MRTTTLLLLAGIAGLGVFALTRTASAVGAVTIYTAPWCGMCPALKTFLRGRGVPYTEKNVETNPRAMTELEALAEKHEQDVVVPVIVIGDTVIFGFRPDELEDLLPTEEPEEEVDPETGEPLPDPFAPPSDPGDPGDGPPPDLPIPGEKEGAGLPVPTPATPPKKTWFIPTEAEPGKIVATGAEYDRPDAAPAWEGMEGASPGEVAPTWRDVFNDNVLGVIEAGLEDDGLRTGAGFVVYVCHTLFPDAQWPPPENADDWQEVVWDKTHTILKDMSGARSWPGAGDTDVVLEIVTFWLSAERNIATCRSGLGWGSAEYDSVEECAAVMTYPHHACDAGGNCDERGLGWPPPASGAAPWRYKAWREFERLAYVPGGG